MGTSHRKGRKKLILILVICIVVIGLGTLGGTLYVTSTGNVKHESNEIILPGTDSNRNALIIYQPGRSAFGATIAANLAKGLNESGYEVTINYPGAFYLRILKNMNL